MNEWLYLVLIGAFLIDLLINDPRWLYHPVEVIGVSARVFESVLRRVMGNIPKVAGVVFLIGILLFWTTVLGVVLYILHIFSFMAFLLFVVYITYALLATGSLVREARVVFGLLDKGDIIAARRWVQEVVSRDMSGEDEKGITRAVIETTTENISDGIVAPLFYYMLGGPMLMLAYKVVNTLDSMVGYKNERYLDFGWASARFDDVLNFIPARITGVLIVCIAFFQGDDYTKAFRVWMRDAHKGPSPNGGIPISAFAGARDIQLGGPCHTKDGGVVQIPFVGGRRKDYTSDEIQAVVQYTYYCAWLAVSLVVGVLFVLAV